MCNRYLMILMIAVSSNSAVADGDRSYSTPGGTVTIPGSSVGKPGDVGSRGHTNIRTFKPAGTDTPQPPPSDFFDQKKLPQSPDDTTRSPSDR
ncbi:hypothetical protein [Hyphomicrobium sp. 2TAF46]|uniref:hypothetical protein n=1 Tax=Hyphomicrobium sp. 2TAF46 TaxID=3233019 RepID=UPI003F908D15